MPEGTTTPGRQGQSTDHPPGDPIVFPRAHSLNALSACRPRPSRRGIRTILNAALTVAGYRE
ncbi:MAG: hypothetical protein HUJ28_09885 [Chromatiales bacterium]|nr:hypothetical protein [Chromatiales bacterium]